MSSSNDPSDEINLILHGRREALPEFRPLRAGPLTMVFVAGDLRYISLAGREIVRRIYVAVRDEKWATIQHELSNVKVNETNGGFRITFDAEHKKGTVHYTWKAEITGMPDGTIRYATDGAAMAEFQTNRTGLCVLHPIRELAGQPCAVTHTDGTVEAGVYPELISPHQPFRDIAAIAHEVTDSVRATLSFEGEIFEMEDQRNWTDTSYKTYCRPHDWPKPYTLKTGEPVRQAVTLSIHGPADRVQSSSRELLEISSKVVGRRPAFGLRVSHDPLELSADMLERLRALRLGYLRSDLKLAEDCAGPLRRAWAQAEALELALGIGAHLSAGQEAAEIERLAACVGAVAPRIGRVILYHQKEPVASARWVEIARRLLPEGTNIGVGTTGNFTELNRNRPDPAAEIRTINYPINSQVHATDNLSLIENLPAQADTVRTARAIAGSSQLAVGPVTLRAMPHVDLRQASLLGAVWTLGSIKRLAESGADCNTYFETVGPNGVMDTSGNEKVRLFPLYHVLQDLAEYADADVLECTDPSPLRWTAMALQKNGRIRVLLANLTQMPITIPMQPPTGTKASGASMLAMEDPATFWQRPRRDRPDMVDQFTQGAGAVDLHLPAFAVLRIDFERL